MWWRVIARVRYRQQSRKEVFRVSPLLLTKEHQERADPLHGTDDIAEQKDGTEDGEELPRGGDDRTGERTKVHHCHEDEGLRGRMNDCHYGSPLLDCLSQHEKD